MPLGIITLFFNVIIILFIGYISVYKNTSWKSGFNGMFIIYCIWALFCFGELANPNAKMEAWNISMTIHFIYPVICAVLVPLTIKRSKDIEWLFILWSIFIIIVVIKGYYQKTVGFNDRELYFLYELGGSETHIIWSGIRYFSYFTDAANFGVHMGMAATGFSIACYNANNKFLKIYYFLIVLMTLYGMGISGTRSAVAIPIVGALLFSFLSGNKKSFYIGLAATIFIFFFFKYTNIGEGNQEIRRIRSAFNPTEDASYLVRVRNREQMKVYMSSKPFGYGLGLEGSKSVRYNPREIMPIPPDSWLISVWIQTGTIGIIVYILLHTILFIMCANILMRKIKNRYLKNQLIAWLCIDAGFFIASYMNDIMQYPNMIIIYTGFALCFAGPAIDKRIEKRMELNKDKYIQ